MTRQVITATAPSHWACYLVNGDSDGMESAEIAAADSFVDYLGGPVMGAEDAGFIWHHDARQFWPFGSDCQEYQTLIEESDNVE